MQNEKLLDRVSEVAEKLKLLVLSETDVTSLHRLPLASSKIPSVTGRFARQKTRDNWLAQKYNLKGAETQEHQGTQLPIRMAQECKCLY